MTVLVCTGICIERNSLWKNRSVCKEKKVRATRGESLGRERTERVMRMLGSSMSRKFQQRMLLCGGKEWERSSPGIEVCGKKSNGMEKCTKRKKK